MCKMSSSQEIMHLKSKQKWRSMKYENERAEVEWIEPVALPPPVR